MRQLVTFVKKEFTAELRSGAILIIGILSVLFGVMNPAVAKLTPWLIEMMSDSLADSGITVGEVTVSAMDSWVQFYKNIPMGLIAFVLIEGGIFTKEFRTGTLILSLTKGLSRYKVIVSKGLVLSVWWSLFYLICFAITYVYNDFYWDNSVAQSLLPSAMMFWIFGVWVISLMIFFSTLCSSSSGVLIGTGGVSFALYLVGAIPKVGNYLPTMLTDSVALIYGTKAVGEYILSLIITLVTGALFFAMSIPVFNKKQL